MGSGQASVAGVRWRPGHNNWLRNDVLGVDDTHQGPLYEDGAVQLAVGM